MMAQLPSSPLARLKDHSGPVHALAYSSGTGQYLLSGSSDRTVKLWNPTKAIDSCSRSGQPHTTPIQTYTGSHNYEVLSLCVSTDNSRFLSGGGDKSVFLWEVSSGKTIRRLGGGQGSHNGKIESVKFGGEGDGVVISGSYDASVRLWDIKAQGNRPMMILAEGRDSVTDVAVAGWEVGAGCVDGRVRWYDIRMGHCIVDVIGASVTSLNTNAQADSMLVSSLDSTLRLLDRSNGKLLRAYTHSSYLNTSYRIRSAFGANDALVLTGSEDGFIYAWDVVSGELAGRVQHDPSQASDARSSKKAVSAVTYNIRSDEWASAGGDGIVVVWGLNNT